MSTRRPPATPPPTDPTPNRPPGPAAASPARRSTHAPERYRDAAGRLYGDARIWDYLRYDDAGDLWINDLRVTDALRRYGAPLEIVDTTIIERRCDEWRLLCESVARQVGYGARLRYLYAAKANMASEVAHAAYRSGWGAETSSRQDLMHLEWLGTRGLLLPDLRVVCNGFKLPASRFTVPVERPGPPAGAAVLPDGHLGGRLRQESYAEAIARMAAGGWCITPILDTDEIEAFATADAPPLNVGLRMKLGPAADRRELAGLVSRFGMEAGAIGRAGAAIAATGNLRWTTLHGMVGSARTLPRERFLAGLLLAADVWADQRSRHESLVELNIGGGLPPLAEPYDHRGVVRDFLAGTAALCHRRGVPQPEVTFELGSLVAEESSFHVFRVLQWKGNHDPAAAPPWAIVDGGLMAAIPDMLLIGKPFRVLAAEAADMPAADVVLGDVTCDPDGRYPPSSFGPGASVPLPAGDGPHHVVIQGVGAYQEILAGVRGAHHCGLLEAAELVLERRSDGRTHGRLLPRQTPADAARLLGYVDPSADALSLTERHARPLSPHAR